MSGLKMGVLVSFTAAVMAVPARATSIREFEAMPPAKQSQFLVRFLEKMTADIGQQNPALASQIKAYYVTPRPGQPFADGMGRISRELAYLDAMAKQGKADLSQIQIEGVVVSLTKQHFSEKMAEK
jgi:hypothetical protein